MKRKKKPITNSFKICYLKRTIKVEILSMMNTAEQVHRFKLARELFSKSVADDQRFCHSVSRFFSLFACQPLNHSLGQ